MMDFQGSQSRRCSRLQDESQELTCERVKGFETSSSRR